MMGLFSQAGSHLRAVASGTTAAQSRPRGSSVGEQAPDDTDPDDTSILDEQEGSIILALISQLRPGMELSRVTFPTFVLEPRSMLERITDFMSHPELIFGAEKCNDPEDRFMRVLQYYLAGWYIKPKGVKKPYNPVLGEFFRCRYDYPDDTQGFYIAEQVSHHPPVSAFYYISPANKLAILGELRPKSKFLGNSVMTTMEGENRVTLLGRMDDGEYVITMPNMYARGILFGKMVLELGDACAARNESTGYHCDLEFKTKGFFSGTYNTVAGHVHKDNIDIGEVSGQWSHVMEFRNIETNSKRVLFDVAKDGQNIVPKWVAPEEEQEPYESRRLWAALTEAIINKDMEKATEAKSAVEDAQRDLRCKREEQGWEHSPRFFTQKGTQWVPKILVPHDPEQATAVVREWIWPSNRERLPLR